MSVQIQTGVLGQNHYTSLVFTFLIIYDGRNHFNSELNESAKLINLMPDWCLNLSGEKYCI